MTRWLKEDYKGVGIMLKQGDSVELIKDDGKLSIIEFNGVRNWIRSDRLRLERVLPKAGEKGKAK